MNRPELMAITLVFLAVLLLLMLFGWLARRRRQKDVAAPLTPPASLGVALGTFEGKYVATTKADDPLDRIAVRGLGFRGYATLTVTGEGMLVQRPGNDDFWIPKSDLRGRRTATWTIDRVVEPDGLELVAWTLGVTPVDTYFQVDQAVSFEKALDQLVPTKEAA